MRKSEKDQEMRIIKIKMLDLYARNHRLNNIQ